MSERPNLRERSRLAVREQLESVAMRLFVENGFEATTVDRIAAEAGISTRSFFRYFPAKEDVVLGDPLEYGAMLRDALEARPPQESARQAVVGAVDAFVDVVEANPGALGVSSVVFSAPSLRARHIEKQRVWVELLLPETLRRLGPVPHARLRAVALITATLVAFDSSLTEWADGGGAVELRTLLHIALAAVDGSVID
ncbi:MAG: TetR family transcriptional regulator [Pseudonocardia sediminis]